jgi:hypothetical protein
MPLPVFLPGGPRQYGVSESSAMTSDWATVSPDLQVSLSREALSQARLLISAQASMLADQMDLGVVPPLDGPDALRLLAMILVEEGPPSRLQ